MKHIIFFFACALFLSCASTKSGVMVGETNMGSIIAQSLDSAKYFSVAQDSSTQITKVSQDFNEISSDSVAEEETITEHIEEMVDTSGNRKTSIDRFITRKGTSVLNAASRHVSTYQDEIYSKAYRAIDSILSHSMLNSYFQFQKSDSIVNNQGKNTPKVSNVWNNVKDKLLIISLTILGVVIFFAIFAAKRKTNAE